jgi:hypothetical protein
MRTTLELPDELFRQVKATAAIKGTTIKELLTQYVETGLRQSDAPSAPHGKRSTLPVIKRRERGVVLPVTADVHARIDEEADVAKIRGSSRQ